MSDYDIRINHISGSSVDSHNDYRLHKPMKDQRAAEQAQAQEPKKSFDQILANLLKQEGSCRQ